MIKVIIFSFLIASPIWAAEVELLASMGIRDDMPTMQKLFKIHDYLKNRYEIPRTIYKNTEETRILSSYVMELILGKEGFRTTPATTEAQESFNGLSERDIIVDLIIRLGANYLLSHDFFKVIQQFREEYQQKNPNNILDKHFDYVKFLAFLAKERSFYLISNTTSLSSDKLSESLSHSISQELAKSALESDDQHIYKLYQKATSNQRHFLSELYKLCNLSINTDLSNGFNYLGSILSNFVTDDKAYAHSLDILKKSESFLSTISSLLTSIEQTRDYPRTIEQLEDCLKRTVGMSLLFFHKRSPEISELIRTRVIRFLKDTADVKIKQFYVINLFSFFDYAFNLKDANVMEALEYFEKICALPLTEMVVQEILRTLRVSFGDNHTTYSPIFNEHFNMIKGILNNHSVDLKLIAKLNATFSHLIVTEKISVDEFRRRLSRTLEILDKGINDGKTLIRPSIPGGPRIEAAIKLLKIPSTSPVA